MKLNSWLVEVLVILTVGLPFLAGPSAADHLPSGVVARGKPEHLLSGVDIHGRINKVIAIYGPPMHVDKRQSQNDPPGAGGRDYSWDRRGVTLDVWTDYYTDERTGKEVESETFSLAVRGVKPTDQMGRTGAGLSLGDSLDTVARIYGRRLFKYTLPNGLLRVQIQWKDETMLTVYFDKQQKIDRMVLEAPVE